MCKACLYWITAFVCQYTSNISKSKRQMTFPTLAAFISPKPSPMHKYTSAQDLPVGLRQTPRRSFHEPWHPGEEPLFAKQLFFPLQCEKGKSVNLPTGYKRKKIDCLLSRSDGILPPGNRAHETQRREQASAHRGQGRKELFFFSLQTISCADSENMSEIGQIYGAAEHIFFTVAFRRLFFSLNTVWKFPSSVLKLLTFIICSAQLNPCDCIMGQVNETNFKYSSFLTLA